MARASRRTTGSSACSGVGRSAGDASRSRGRPAPRNASTALPIPAGGEHEPIDRLGQRRRRGTRRRDRRSIAAASCAARRAPASWRQRRKSATRVGVAPRGAIGSASRFRNGGSPVSQSSCASVIPKPVTMQRGFVEPPVALLDRRERRQPVGGIEAGRRQRLLRAGARAELQRQCCRRRPDCGTRAGSRRAARGSSAIGCDACSTTRPGGAG